MANNEQLPKVGEDTKLLCFDIESNGLHGDAFAVAAVVMNSKGEVLDEFTGRTEIEGKVDEWVEANVLPVMTDMDVTHSSFKHLRDNFWSWFMKAQAKADYVIVLNGYPVEYRFLIKCQEDDLENRFWDHPFPLLDLTSILLQAGYSSSDRNKAMQEIMKETGYTKHHPLHDAKMTALMAFKAFAQQN